MRAPLTSLLPVLLVGACTSAQHDDARMPTNADAVSSYTILCGTPWATRNLDVATYRNGDPIPQVTDPTAWVKLTTGAWCWYNNDPHTYHRYGKLYNWYAVNDTRGLAPQGWHVLTDVEWEAMERCLGEDSVGYRMRATGAVQWPGPATAIDNSSGFEGLPSGMRSDNGAFSHAGHSAVYWLSAEGSASEAWCGRLIHYTNNQGVPAMVTGLGYMNKADGYSVRCVKDPLRDVLTPVDLATVLDTAQAYSTAIADYIHAMDTSAVPLPDTVYIGRHVEFPRIELPAVMARRSVRIVDPAEGEREKHLTHFAYLNIFATFTTGEVEFYVVRFTQGLRHQPDGSEDRHLDYRVSERQELVLERVSR